jgi:enoyl-CoA hydratase/carnithine racemase
LIPAVEGYALGGGFEIILACGLVVAARDATFGLPEVARGVLPTSGALFRARGRGGHDPVDGLRSLPQTWCVARSCLASG